MTEADLGEKVRELGRTLTAKFGFHKYYRPDEGYLVNLEKTVENGPLRISIRPTITEDGVSPNSVDIHVAYRYNVDLARDSAIDMMLMLLYLIKRWLMLILGQ